MNCEHIAPVAQHDVRALLDKYEGDAEIKRIIIFGSACSWRFEMWSDIDVYVDGPASYYASPVSNVVAYDMWCPSMVDEKLYKEILETGVVVFENT